MVLANWLVEFLLSIGDAADGLSMPVELSIDCFLKETKSNYRQ